jgi:phosphate-selective porin OprO/OprP
LGFAVQYFWMSQEIQPAPVGPATFAPVDVPFEGFYVLTTYLLTGEERTTYSQAIAPLRPFDPYCPLACGGAWELVARVSRLEVGDAAFRPGASRLANPSLYSSGATELTVGCNWYLNKLVRMQFNWEHAWFDDPVQRGLGGGFVDGQDTLLTRFQVIF